MEFIGFTWLGLFITVTIVFIVYTIWTIVRSGRRSTMAILFFIVLLSVSLMNLYGTRQFYVEDTVIGAVEGKEREGTLSGRSGMVDVYVKEWKVEELVGKDVGMICKTTIVGNLCEVKVVSP